MRLRVKNGRLSDLAQAGHRADWSGLNDKLKAIEPGEVVSAECPKGVSLSAFRSTILTNGKRFHQGAWVLTTRKEGSVIHCFLAPAEKNNS